MKKACGECFFLDVGQGTANVILLEGGRALVIDTGPARRGIVKRLLVDYGVREIECVVLSHNDRDHIAGWEDLAICFGGMIHRIYTLQDRNDVADGVDSTVYMVNNRLIPRPIRAEVSSLDQPRVLWEDKKLSLRLVLFYPDMMANRCSLVSGNPNQTSAIVAFYCHEKFVLFPGDSTISAWRCLADHSGKLPLSPEIMAFPHHGGLLTTRVEKAELDWLLAGAVHPRVAIVSVGTSNGFGHPRAEVIAALVRASVKVMCTQITKRCHTDVGAMPAGCVSASHYSASSGYVGEAGGHVACAGTIVAAFGEDLRFVIAGEADHNNLVKRLSHPMCVQGI